MIKMKFKRIYEIFSLIVGVSAVITLTFFLITSPYKCIIPFEPINYIRIPEIIIGLSVLPYYALLIIRSLGGLKD